jgi:hypothetical protein
MINATSHWPDQAAEGVPEHRVGRANRAAELAQIDAGVALLLERQGCEFDAPVVRVIGELKTEFLAHPEHRAIFLQDLTFDACQPFAARVTDHKFD